MRRHWPQLVLLPAAVITLVPLVWLGVASFKHSGDFATSMFLPRDDATLGERAVERGEAPPETKPRSEFLGVGWSKLTTRNYSTLLLGPDKEALAQGAQRVHMDRALMNSVFLSATTAILATLCCAAGGYALALFRFRGRTAATVLVLAALIIPPPLLIAPGYQWLHRLGLLDSYAGLILPAIAPAFGVFLFRQAAMRSIPRELLDAARIDGSGEGATFFIVALPLMRPMIGAFLMITFLATWNNFISPQIVLQSPEKFPLSVAIAQLRDVYQQDAGLIMAGTVLSVLPVMALFLLLQREFISGLTTGAVKG